MFLRLLEREAEGGVPVRQRNENEKIKKKKKENFFAFTREPCDAVSFKEKVSVFLPDMDPPCASLSDRLTLVIPVDFGGVLVDPLTSFDQAFWFRAPCLPNSFFSPFHPS